MAVETEILPDRYRDVTRIARGGMGDVYRARDSVLGRLVAVKLLSERYAANEEIRKRFTREALAAARLSADRNVVTIYDVGETNSRPFIVMQYLPGGSLEELLHREGAQSPQRALPWLESAADALDYAHAHGVVHRDVKPANILLDEDGGAHVADFGIATAAGLASLTQTGTILGTAGYLAPEQAEGRPAGPTADRYSLAVVAFELLTGTRPFENDSPTAEAAAHVRAPVPAISSKGRGIPREADPVFRRALAKNPADRFDSCAEFVAALRDAYASAAGATRVARPAPDEPRTIVHRSRSRRVPLLLGALALVLAGGAIAGALVAGGGGSSAPPTRVTVTERGTTVRQTVTEQQPTTAAPASAGASGATLAQEGYQKLQAGDPAGALPLLQQAAQKLQGTNSLNEAYNDYNLAVALTQTQGCSQQVLQLLDASQAIQGHRAPIDHLRNECAHSTGPGNPKDKGHGKGKGKDG
jgi:eukaryotic-like serine/threonine-protein kinase